MSEQFKTAVKDGDLIRAFITGVAAAIIMSYVASVAKPGIIHLVLGLMSVCVIVAAYLLVARSTVDAAGKTAAIVGTGVVGGLCLLGLPMLLSGNRQAPTSAIASPQTATSFDYILGGCVVVGLLIYLVYALLRPEKF